MTLTELLTRRPNMLLDFDGPVCSVFSTLTSEDVSRRLYERLQQASTLLPADPAPADPFDVLRRIKSLEPQLSGLAETALSELELRAIQSAKPTPHVVEMLQALTAAGHRVVIVSNNGRAAINSFLIEQSLSTYFTDVAARVSADPDLLKPHPHLLMEAASKLGVAPGTCVLLGDSVTDVQAARRAGAGSIAFVNKPHKQKPLNDAGPDALVTELAEVIAALHSTA